MSESDFWPGVQPLDDIGADPGDGGDKAFGLQLNLGSEFAPPADTAEKLKSILQTNEEETDTSSTSQPAPKELVSKANKLKKEINDAFPLLDR